MTAVHAVQDRVEHQVTKTALRCRSMSVKGTIVILVPKEPCFGPDKTRCSAWASPTSFAVLAAATIFVNTQSRPKILASAVIFLETEENSGGYNGLDTMGCGKLQESSAEV